VPVPDGVESFVERYIREQIDDEEETRSLIAGETLVENENAQSVATQGGVMYPVALASFREGEPVLAAVGILRLATGSKPPNHELLETLARELIEHGDAGG
jgi:hypothetical protein